MTHNEINDLVIDYLHASGPNLLQDDVFVEGLVFLCCRVHAKAWEDFKEEAADVVELVVIEQRAQERAMFYERLRKACCQ